MKSFVRQIPKIRTALRPQAAVCRPRSFSSAAAALDEELEREFLYGTRGTSPISEFFDLAVNEGHTAMGPPPKYRVSEPVMLKCGISEDDISFKTTNYGNLVYAPHVQHQEHKVTMRVKDHVLPLNEFEKRILKEIVGNRFREDRNELQMSSDQFGSRIENKRHLTSMLDRLVFAARKLAAAAEGKEAKAEE